MKRNREELARLFERAQTSAITGRDPKPHWFGEKPARDTTLCVRITLRDRDRLIKALRRKR